MHRSRAPRDIQTLTMSTYIADGDGDSKSDPVAGALPEIEEHRRSDRSQNWRPELYCVDDVEKGLQIVVSRILRANLDSLRFHPHVLCALIQDAGDLPSSDLPSRYAELVDHVYRERALNPSGARRNKLAKLREYDLVECEGDSRHRRYWVRDETIAPPIELDVTPAHP